jgi:hypothetical protein
MIHTHVVDLLRVSILVFLVYVIVSNVFGVFQFKEYLN